MYPTAFKSQLCYQPALCLHSTGLAVQGPCHLQRVGPWVKEATSKHRWICSWHPADLGPGWPVSLSFLHSQIPPNLQFALLLPHPEELLPFWLPSCLCGLVQWLGPHSCACVTMCLREQDTCCVQDAHCAFWTPLPVRMQSPRPTALRPRALSISDASRGAGQW